MWACSRPVVVCLGLAVFAAGAPDPQVPSAETTAVVAAASGGLAQEPLAAAVSAPALRGSREAGGRSGSELPPNWRDAATAEASPAAVESSPANQSLESGLSFPSSLSAPAPASASASALAPENSSSSSLLTMSESLTLAGTGSQQACLCVFDIDRTLTGRQGDTGRCPHNRVMGFWDSAYDGGRVTLSPLASHGIRSTFCNGCVLGICSAGRGSGPGSAWNNFLLNDVLRGDVHDQFLQRNPNGFKRWSYGTHVHSPYVLAQGDRRKQDSVDLIRQWYAGQGINVPLGEAYFFGDRTENIMPFSFRGLNSREVSCNSRDHGGSIGYCGASPQEIVKSRGNHLCR